MILRALFILLAFVGTLLANKVIYFSYQDIPQRVIKGEIFPVTLKTLTTVRDFQDIQYIFDNYYGIEILNEIPQREKKGKYFYDTFYIRATADRAKLPDAEAYLIAPQEHNASRIEGPSLHVIALNPDKKFANIVADDFTLKNYKTTSYDNTHNIVVLSAEASNSYLDDIRFNNVFKQGIESINDSFQDAKITAYVVIDKKYEQFVFSYFNLKKNDFVRIEIPIIVDDDRVSTQTDLKPKDQSHEKIKIYIASGIAFVGFLLILWRKKYIYLLFIFLPLAYILYIAAPQAKVCIKKGSAIHLLPVDNGTIFEVTQEQLYLPKEGNAQNYVKVRLENEKIGWIKNEDTCSN